MDLERLLKVTTIILILSYLLVAMCSCGRKHWTNRGEKKGWIETKIDTIVTDSVVTDTIFKHNLVRDTLTLHKDKLTVKYFFNTHDSTVYLWGKCDSDTVFVQKQIINMVKSGNWFKDNWFQILCVLIIAFLIFMYKK
jgi:uncharacterized membrane protein